MDKDKISFGTSATANVADVGRNVYLKCKSLLKVVNPTSFGYVETFVDGDLMGSDESSENVDLKYFLEKHTGNTITIQTEGRITNVCGSEHVPCGTFAAAFDHFKDDTGSDNRQTLELLDTAFPMEYKLSWSHSVGILLKPGDGVEKTTITIDRGIAGDGDSEALIKNTRIVIHF